MDSPRASCPHPRFNVRTIYGWIDSGIIPADRWERRGPKSIFILASEAARLRDTSDK